MKKIVFLLVILVLISLLALIGIHPKATLQANNLQYDAEQNTYLIEFFEEEQHSKFASAFVRVDPVAVGLSQLTMQFWHRPESQIRSLSLDFQSSQMIPDLSFQLPSYASWPAFQFAPKDERSVSFQVPNLGSLGVGSVNLGFLLDTRGTSVRDLSLNIHMHFDSPSLLEQNQNASVLIRINFPE